MAISKDKIIKQGKNKISHRELKTSATIPVGSSTNISIKNKYRHWVYLPAILLLTVILYIGSLKGDILHCDDDGYIILNTAIHKLDAENIREIFTGFYAANYHPLTTLTWAIEYSFAGEKYPLLYRIDNLLLHLLNILLVFWLFKLISKKNNVALLIALLHAVHPMHVESVAWISERKDVLFSLFFLQSLVMYLLYLHHTSPVSHGLSEQHKTGKIKALKYILFSIVFFILSLLSKSAAVILPVTLFLIDFLLKRKINLNMIAEKLPFIALSLLFGILALKTQQGAMHFNISSHFSTLQHLLIICYTVSKYLFMAVIPFGLSAFHPWPELNGTSLPSLYYLSPAVMLLLIYIVIHSWKRKRIAAFGLLFFFSGLALVLQIIPVGGAVMAERYTYLPYLGLFYILAEYFNQIYEENILKRKFINYSLTALLIIVITVYSFVALGRTKVWMNDRDLWDDMITNYPTTAYDAYLYRAKYRLSTNDVKGAYEDFSKLIKWKKYDSDALASRGELKVDSGNYAGAMEDFDRSIAIDSTNYLSLNNRGALKMKMNDLGEALDNLNRSIRHKKDYYLSWFNRGAVYIGLKNYKKALKDFDQAMKLKENYCEAMFARGVAFADSGLFREAISSYEGAITCNPKYSDAYVNLGSLKMQMNNDKGAMEDLLKAADINPGSYIVYHTIAKLKIKNKEYEEAVRYLKQCISLNASYATAYATLGTCSFNTGKKSLACQQWLQGVQLGSQECNAFLKTYCK